MSGQAFDYVVGGAGSAGAALAARLAEGGQRVALIEAGGNARSLYTAMPAANGFLFGNPTYDWGYESVPQSGLGGRRIYYPRGRGLGGSSLLNGMIHIRGVAGDYDRWRDKGLASWGFADALPYFRRLEAVPHRSGPYHGRQGPLKVSPAGGYDRINEIFVKAACEAGAARNDDFNGRRRAGAGRFDSAIHKGRRSSSAASYLRPPPKGLSIFTGTRVVRVAFEGGRAVGLVVRRQGAERLVRAEREAVLCLGAFASPQILMLSGVGPADHLSAHGVAVAADLPGVGATLYDHPNVSVAYEIRDPALSVARHQRLDRALVLGARWLATRSGPGAAAFWSANLFHALRDAEAPELQVFFTPMVVREEAAGGAGLFEILNFGRKMLARAKSAAPGVQFDINLMRPQSVGSLRLASADPEDHPLIDPNYFAHEGDVADLLAGVRHMREVAAQPAFREVLGPEIAPGAAARSDTDLIAAMRAGATTGHHPVSTCPMGADDDPLAVLDAAFRVRGVEGLRVVDASAFPDQITGNPNSTIIMLAERAADMMLGREPLAPTRLEGERP